MSFSIEHLLTLARTYSDETGLTLTGVGLRACGNNKVFTRLAAGHGANVLTVMRAFKWFDDNWPEGAEWPKNVPRPEPVR